MMGRMRMQQLGRPWRLLAATALLAAFVGPAQAAVPTTVAIEGRLMTAQGGLVTDGSYAVTFALYPSQNAQQAAWTETVAQLPIKAGVFRHVLGSSKPLSASLLDASKAGWLGIKVGNEPELARRPLHAVPYALRAGIAEGIDCTGCVSISALKADGDLDLGGNAVSAGKISAQSIQAGTVTAQTFVGDGSKLTGVPMPKGICAAGQVLTGIGPGGKLLCAAGGAGNDLDAISGGLLTTKYAEPQQSANMPIEIDDFNPIGISDKIIVDDVGKLQKFSVSVHISSSDVSGVRVILYDPANVAYTLYDGGKTGKELKETWPGTAVPVQGDLNTWLGKNPKGQWILRVVDTKFITGGKDGKLESWSINVLSASGKQVTSKGMFVAKGGFKVAVAAAPPAVCGDKTHGHMYYDTKLKAMYYCDGDWRKMLTESLCGNNVVNSDENCDDGNDQSGDGCTSKCQKNVCGDGVVWIGKEECDDGNLKDGDECTSKCLSPCKFKCSNGSCLDCNVAGQTLIKNSAFVDPNTPAGWTQCFGFLNTAGDDVGPKSPDNCLNAKALRMRIIDAGGNIHADVYGTVNTSLAAWPSSVKYITGSLTLAKCGNPMWPCGNTSGFYGATNGTGGAGCNKFAPGGMNFSNANGNQVTVAPAEPKAGKSGGREIGHGECYGNAEWIGYKAAIYKQ